MRAYVCDTCKESYAPYVFKSEGDELGVAANGMTFVKFERDSSMKGRGKIELCPKCMEKLQTFIFDELCVSDDSPFIKKVLFYRERNAKKSPSSSTISSDASDEVVE